MWTLDNALKLIRETQETAKGFGYHICLGGSVLNKGESIKDLDLYFIPLVGVEESIERLLQSLYIGWGDGEEFGYIESYQKLSPYRHTIRFKGIKPSDAFIGTVEVFIV